MEGSRLLAGRALKASEVCALFDAARRDKRRRRGARDAAVVALLWGAGLRRLEVCRLNRETFNGQSVRVVGKGNREREVPLPDGARRALEAWLRIRGDDPGPLIWSVAPWQSRRLRPEAIAVALQQLARRAGVENVSTHDGRRTFITQLFDAGANPGAIHDHPLWQAFLAAPIDDGPIPEEEARAMAEARQCTTFVDGAVVTAEIAARAAAET